MKLQPLALAEAHMEVRSAKESLPVLTDLLLFEQVAAGPGGFVMKHPASEWELVVHEASGATEKQMHNHFGVRVISNAEVNAAYRYLSAHKSEYELADLKQPEYSHGSFSIYFKEPGTNGWEIECFEDVLRKESGGTRLGGVRSPHWSAAISPDRFPGRGYVPQAFTHGTLLVGDEERSAEFYREVLGLECWKAYAHVVYLKHPASKHYVVCLCREGENSHSPNFRYTLTLKAAADVEDAHEWLRRSGGELGITELGDLRGGGDAASFLLRDLDRNWWEIAAGDTHD
ncbi:MAG TPA: VOC family protein [Chloroflexota bacterium]|nr:VOC family protein [Chloroflexota bacterium]